MTTDSDLIEARAALELQPCLCKDGFKCSRCKGLAAFGRAGVEVPDETGRNNTDGPQTQSSAGANASHPSTEGLRERLAEIAMMVRKNHDGIDVRFNGSAGATIDEAIEALTQPDPRIGSDARERLAREIADHARAGYGKDLGVYAKRMSEAVRVDEGAQSVRDDPHEYDEEGLYGIRCGSMTYCEIAPIRTVSLAATQQQEDEIERNRGSNWRDKLDDKGVPTCGPARSDYGCQYCFGPLDAKRGTGQYECPWCIARFPGIGPQRPVEGATCHNVLSPSPGDDRTGVWMPTDMYAALTQQEQGEKVTAKAAPGRFSRIISKPFWSDQWGWWLVRVRWEDGRESVADLAACVPARTVSAAEVAEYERVVRLAAEVPRIHTEEKADG